MGRATVIDQQIRLDDGTLVPIGVHVVDQIAAGLTQNQAARASSIAPTTITHWRQKGAAARQALEAGIPVTPAEESYARFLDEYEAAEHKRRADIIGRIYKAGTEPEHVKKITIKKALNEAGEMVEIERTEVVEERPARWTALAWIAERRWPQEYGRRIVDLNHAMQNDEDGSAEDWALRLGSELDAFLAGYEDATADRPGVIDVAEITAAPDDDDDFDGYPLAYPGGW